MAVSQSLRSEVFRRDDYTCQYCGARPRLLTMVRAGKRHTTLHVDHMVPRIRGGLDLIKNLATACSGCNSAKKDKAWPFPLAYCAGCSEIFRGLDFWDEEGMGYPIYACDPCTADEPEDDVVDEDEEEQARREAARLTALLEDGKFYETYGNDYTLANV